MLKLNKALGYFLILTIISSFLAFRIIVTAYDNAFAFDTYLTE